MKGKMLRNSVVAAVAALSCLASAAGIAQAQDTQAQDNKPAPDKSMYNLFNPTPKDLMRPFNTDRPTKSNVPYTVDAGHFQYEGDIFIYSFDNTTTPDTDNTSWVLFNPTFKAGLTNWADLEVNFSAQNIQRNVTRSTGATTANYGFGDTFTRLKMNLWGNDGGTTAFALIPYGKWPTAPIGVGNGYAEGGIIAPLAISLPLGFTTILMGEVDYLKNPVSPGYRANFQSLININRTIIENVTGYAEIYANWPNSPDLKNTYTLDFAIAWTPLPNFQLDVGINIGLVPAATPYQIYMGIAQRF
jgi:hypothetical protein